MERQRQQRRQWPSTSCAQSGCDARGEPRGSPRQPPGQGWGATHDLLLRHDERGSSGGSGGRPAPRGAARAQHRKRAQAKNIGARAGMPPPPPPRAARRRRRGGHGAVMNGCESSADQSRTGGNRPAAAAGASREVAAGAWRVRRRCQAPHRVSTPLSAAPSGRKVVCRQRRWWTTRTLRPPPNQIFAMNFSLAPANKELTGGSAGLGRSERQQRATSGDRARLRGRCESPSEHFVHSAPTTCFGVLLFENSQENFDAAGRPVGCLDHIIIMHHAYALWASRSKLARAHVYMSSSVVRTYVRM